MPQFLACYHPYADRFLFYPEVESCRLCADSRRLEKPGDRKAYWPPLTRPKHLDWTPHPYC